MRRKDERKWKGKKMGEACVGVGGEEKRKNGRAEMGKSASVCVWGEEKKNGRRNEGADRGVWRKKMWGRVEKLER